MAYNLIDERWIPVERQSGKLDWIAPSGISDPTDPPVRVASARPDFDGALLEFLVGILQTAAAPASEREWEGRFETPLTQAELDQKFKVVRQAFDLDGDGPRFMQDLTVATEVGVREVPVGALLIDRIGEEGLSESPSLFAKPGGFDALGYPAAAAALMALQTYAPAGGRGQLTSMRGGGPLTTLVLAGNLWQTAWLNVLPVPDFETRVTGAPKKNGLADIFPWMAKTRVSSTKGGSPTLPSDVHPLQTLWGLPRRIRLVIDPAVKGTCGVYGTVGVPVVSAYVSRPDGTSYEGDVRHPWSPYALVADGQPWNPKKGSADGLPYRDWPQLVTSNKNWRPATVVSWFAQGRRRELIDQPRLVAFGYAMDNMKPLRWCRSETPLITVEPDRADSFAGEVQALVAVSDDVRKTLSSQLRSAWSDRPKDLDVFDRINPAFWSATEPDFFGAVQALKRCIQPTETAGRDAAKETWLLALHRAALSLFDDFVDASASLAPPDLRRLIVARRDLAAFTHPSARKLRKLLGMLAEELAEPSTQRKARKPRKEKTT